MAIGYDYYHGAEQHFRRSRKAPQSDYDGSYTQEDEDYDIQASRSRYL